MHGAHDRPELRADARASPATATQIDEADGTVRAYGYDELYRLTVDTVTIGALNQYTKTFAYDDVGQPPDPDDAIGPAGSSGAHS